MIVIVPQLEPLNVTGAMKSLISDVNAVEERDFTYTELNGSHAFGGETPAQVRLIDASPNCCAGRLTGARPPRFSEIVWLFVAPSEHVEEMGTPVPQSVPFQVYFVNVGVFDPPWKAWLICRLLHARARGGG